MAQNPKGRRGGASSDSPFETERELVVVARSEAGVRARPAGLESVASADVSRMSDTLRKHRAQARPLFGKTEERLLQEASIASAEAENEIPDLSVYYHVDVDEERMEELCGQLGEAEAVEAAYIKPGAEPPALLNDMMPSEEEAPSTTPDFTSRQGYLDPAPVGVDARFAWTQAGGRGTGIRIIDIEGAWRFSHEDLLQNQGGVVGGTQSTALNWRNHGTAVVGEYGGDRNSFGITGIAPDAHATAISIFGGPGSAGAIRMAADRLRRGDVILIELHRPGPRHNFQSRNDQRGYIAIEWWPDDFDAIRYATSRGVIVVEAAGNGAENLDDAIYSVRPAGFPASWTNPFNRSNRDSGAIIVGAGAPPPGTHGRNHGPDRSRLDFSNWGASVDAQGWGREVTTAGYGDLQGGSNEDLWYTDTFSGTSSASPIVVGAIAAVQGILRARGSTLMTPAKARQCLRTTGSTQQDAPGRPRTQRIGNRPNIRALLTCAIGPVIKNVKEIKEIKEIKEKDQKDIKEKELKEFKEKEKEKDIKEVKDVKEVKEIRETKLHDLKAVETGIRQLQQIRPTEHASGLEERLARLEATVTQLAHFIQPELRPDLSTGALGYESDLTDEERRSLERQRRAEAQADKDYKDSKDIEKLSEY